MMFAFCFQINILLSEMEKKNMKCRKYEKDKEYIWGTAFTWLQPNHYTTFLFCHPSPI